MFSMVALASKLSELDEATLARHGVLLGTGSFGPAAKVLSLDWPELERVLPDRGLPCGVVEIAAPMGGAISKPSSMRGGATTIALAAAAAVHRKDDKAWCAWITPSTLASLYAPAVMQAGVDLERLLVVRPEPSALARTAVKAGASGAFELVVVDAFAGLDGRLGSKGERGRTAGDVVVRKLALASEDLGTTFLLLTNAYAPSKIPLPVAMRLEVERRPEAIAIRITKDRRGRASSQHVVRIAS